MGNWTLDDVDELIPTDRWSAPLFVQRDDRDPAAWSIDEPLATLGLLLRLGRPKLRFKRRRYWPRAILHCAVAPPPFVIDVAHACGATVFMGRWQPERLERLRERSPSLPAMNALAQHACQRVADSFGVAVDLHGLAHVGNAAPRLDRAAGDEPYWPTCLRLAAFTGEVLRRRIGGRWTMTPLVSNMGLALHCGFASDANVVDKAMKLLASGSGEESLVSFVGMVESIVKEMG